ncbi:MAG: SGNH/GDSL hydrolase family protein [Lentisphaerae bacterium]|nr:SGNH/GDSL hydrolase family protein [Lentisphaerota bacterium]
MLLPQPYLQVVLFGASLTWSMRAPYGQRYADCLEQALRARLGGAIVVDVAACGAGGNTAREALPRLDRDVAAYQPDVVVVSLGANDCGREEKAVFEKAYVEVLQALAERTAALVVCETTPVLDEEWHAYRDRDFAKAAGGINRHIEAFTHEYVRRTVAARGLILHDRFRIYHDALAADPGVRERLIRRDGVHLTEAGNAFFAETLAERITAALPGRPTRPAGSAAEWLAKANGNAVLQAAMAAAQADDPAALRGVLLRDDPVTRLMLQQARSCARRAGALSTDEAQRAAAERLAALAAAFLGMQRVLNPATPLAASGSRSWVEERLRGVDAVPAGLQRLCQEAP